MTQPFVPDRFVVPEKFAADGFVLRKLTVDDAVKDYDAVMSSRESLRHVFCERGSWPADEMTLQENIADLRKHQEEFDSRVAFAYTVATPDNSRCLGCVYIYPWSGPVFDARVFYWVRESERETNLDETLGRFLRDWIQRAWPIERPIFPGRDLDWKAWAAVEEEAKQRASEEGDSAIPPQSTHRRPAVIGIAGGVAAGKTTLARLIAEKLGGVTLLFDDYDRFGEWPQDLPAWLDQGADPSQVRVPRLAEDLRALMEGRPIVHPQTGDSVQPADHILIEEPFGRERPELAPLIDRLLYVDVPADVSVLRLTQRALRLDCMPEDGPAGLTQQDLAERVLAAAGWLVRYTLFRAGYAVIRKRLLADADLVLDGMLPPEALSEQAIQWIHSI